MLLSCCLPLYSQMLNNTTTENSPENLTDAELERPHSALDPASEAVQAGASNPVKGRSTMKLGAYVLDLLLDLAIVAVMVFFIRTFLFAPFRVHGPSMCNTFNFFNNECYGGDGEYILVSRVPLWKWTPSPLERGDVVVFQAPYSADGEYYIKRILGLPGDVIKISNGFVFLQNAEGQFEELNESYLNEENLGHTQPYLTQTEIYKVPDGKYFVMGDNRLHSSDSRRCFEQLGCTTATSPYLDAKLIEGEVKLVMFPFSHFRWIKDMEY